MNHYHVNTRTYFALFLALTILGALPSHAQFNPGQGFGGGGQGNRGQQSSSAAHYPANGAVGDAVISIAPDSRNLIIISDEPTRQYISQVVSNLDQPKPQVLIKVVFLEVTHNDSSDIGLEG